MLAHMFSAKWGITEKKKIRPMHILNGTYWSITKCYKKQSITNEYSRKMLHKLALLMRKFPETRATFHHPSLQPTLSVFLTMYHSPKCPHTQERAVHNNKDHSLSYSLMYPKQAVISWPMAGTLSIYYIFPFFGLCPPNLQFAQSQMQLLPLPFQITNS